MSTIFFLSNRLEKAIIGSAEYDKAMEEFEDIEKKPNNDENKSIYENKKSELNEILAKYF